MDTKEKMKEAWIAHNQILQMAYRSYVQPRNKKEKDKAASDIQLELRLGPFSKYVSKYETAYPEGISRYGLDYLTERCIGEIDLIAKEKQDFPDDLF